MNTQRCILCGHALRAHDWIWPSRCAVKDCECKYYTEEKFQGVEE